MLRVTGDINNWWCRLLASLPRLCLTERSRTTLTSSAGGYHSNGWSRKRCKGYMPIHLCDWSARHWHMCRRFWLIPMCCRTGSTPGDYGDREVRLLIAMSISISPSLTQTIPLTPPRCYKTSYSLEEYFSNSQRIHIQLIYRVAVKNICLYIYSHSIS